MVKKSGEKIASAAFIGEVEQDIVRMLAEITK